MNNIILKTHQQRCLDKIESSIAKGRGELTGRIVIPTGGGKTFIEAFAIGHQMKKRGRKRIHLVLVPRIILAKQLMGEFRKALGYDFRAMAFHSGHHEPEDERISWKEFNTTNPTILSEYYYTAKKAKQDLIVFSTYHSCGRLEGIEFDTLIADESQYCVAENFGSNVQQVSAKVKLFFTATEKFTASKKGRGLNNESTFGKRLFYISPEKLISKGIIIPPRLHIMYGETINEEASMVHQVLELGREQDKLTRPSLGFSKILFAMNGTGDVKTIEDNIKKLKTELPVHDVFTITSKTGAKINGVKIRREDFLERLATCENALIFHYDILSEGIDIDGITGVALMRNLGLAKLLQTIGRAVRPYKADPSKKPQAWISIPVINGNEDDKARVKEIIGYMRLGGFDISKEDVIETGKNRHQGDEEEIDDAYGKKKNNYSSLFIEGVLHEIEEDDFLLAISSTNNVKKKLDILMDKVGV